MHLVYPPPQLKIFITGFQFLLGITVVSREIQDTGYGFFYLGGGGGGKESALWSMLKSWIVADGCYSE